VPDQRDFEEWYVSLRNPTGRDALWQRVLDLPPDLLSTGLVGGAAFDEILPRLDLGPDRVLLDLACGRGGYGLEAARRTGCRLVGVDFSPAAIAHAVDLAARYGLTDRARFAVGTMSATGLDDASVDAVLLLDAIQFAEPAIDAVRECHRVLRPGGRIVITTWEALDHGDERLSETRRSLDVAAVLTTAGFDDVEVVERPDWFALEQDLWQATIDADTGADQGIAAAAEEARHVLANTSAITRRVLGTARA
jgi:SAM-dependent methyltransferase